MGADVTPELVHMCALNGYRGCVSTAPGPTVLDAASLLCEVADELVVRTVRDTHTAWVDRVYGVGRLATRAESPSLGERAHRGIASAVYAGVGGGLRLASTGRCLDARNAGTADGTIVQVWECNGSAAQQWLGFPTPNGGAPLKNTHSGRCVDVPGGDIAPGTRLQIYDCNWKAYGLTMPIDWMRWKLASRLNRRNGINKTSSGTTNRTYFMND